MAIFRPHKLEEVKSALAAHNVTGITVSDVRGCGASAEQSDWHLGQEYVISLPQKIKLEAVVEDDLKEEAIEAIIEAARTGRPGDGKIFVYPEERVVRIRTGESGRSAL